MREVAIDEELGEPDPVFLKIKRARLVAEDGSLVAVEFLPYQVQNKLMGQLCWLRDLEKDLDRVRYVAYDP